MLDIDINKTKTIKEFATSSFFVQLAKNYIGKKKKNFNFWAMLYLKSHPCHRGTKKKILLNIFTTIIKIF